MVQESQEKRSFLPIGVMLIFCGTCQMLLRIPSLLEVLESGIHLMRLAFETALRYGLIFFPQHIRLMPVRFRLPIRLMWRPTHREEWMQEELVFLLKIGLQCFLKSMKTYWTRRHRSLCAILFSTTNMKWGTRVCLSN